jgi:UTP-glucose-1-phosphate uridylyltransferase
MRAIIPCAGYGTGMKMRIEQSKEMLPDPNKPDFYIIDYVLDLCKSFDFEPLIISRKEKTSLNNYIESQGVECFKISPTGEWMKSILQARDGWHENNIVILPNTRFGRFGCFQAIEHGLNLGNNAVFATHKVTDPENWGIIKNYTICDKPKNMFGTQMAWGLIGFKSNYGQTLFSRLPYTTQLENVGFTKLDWFKDITRG